MPPKRKKPVYDSDSDSHSDESSSSSYDSRKKAAPRKPAAKAAPKKPAAKAAPKKPAAKAAPKKPSSEPASKRSKDNSDEKKFAQNPPVSDLDIFSLGANAFFAGLDYHEQKKVHSITNKHHFVSGKCKGRAAEDYVVSIVWTDDEKIDWDKSTCTCALKSEKNTNCKHMAALLFSWQEEVGGTAQLSLRTNYKPAEQKKINNMIEQKRPMTVVALQALLRGNKQSTTGNKPLLLERVADMIVFGALPKCPTCFGGKLRYRAGYYYCPGFMEDDEYQECDFFSQDIKRESFQDVSLSAHL